MKLYYFMEQYIHNTFAFFAPLRENNTAKLWQQTGFHPAKTDSNFQIKSELLHTKVSTWIHSSSDLCAVA